jgi:hypothetical protein
MYTQVATSINNDGGSGVDDDVNINVTRPEALPKSVE